MSSTTVNRYITSFSVSNALPKEEQEQAIEQWASQHSEEHEIFFYALNGLNTATKGEPYKINFNRLGFNVKDIASFNNFVVQNNFQMNQFFEWLNILGETMPTYGKPLMIIYPLINPTRKVMRFNLNTINYFMYMEEKSHTIVASAINQMYANLGT